MLEGQTFIEVFPDYTVPDNLKYVLSNAIVSKVVMKQQTRQLVVHLRSEHIIPRKVLNKVAYDMKKELFGKTSVFISFDDTYELSSAYTLESITNDYWNSILHEVKKMGRVEYSLLSNGEWGFEGNIMTILLEDSFLARDKSRVLKEYLEHLFSHRFGKEIQVGFDFTDDAKQAFYKARNHKLNLEVDMVMSQIKKVESEKKDSDAEDGEGSKEEKKPQRSYSGNFFEERARRQEFSQRRRSKDPDVIYGKDCDGEVVPLEEIVDEIGQVVVRGQILKMELREIRRERTIVSFHITDFTDTIVGKIFIANDQLPEFLDLFEKGKFYKVKGMPRMDTFEHDLTLSSISGIKPIPDFTEKRMDKSLEKRVELHLHTVMSDLDSVVDIKKVINQAKAWGHPAMAITDHGVLQAFPIANHCITMDEPFKIIYGVEGYFVNDLKKLVTNDKGQTLLDDYVVFDLETTGFSPIHDAIIEIGAVKVSKGKISDHYSVFVNPQRPIPLRITELTSIDDSMVADAKSIEEILPEFLSFCEGCSLVAHNAEFDVSFIEENAKRQGFETDFTVLDTVQMARLLLTDLNKFKLNTVCKRLNIKQEHHHRAVDDARVTAEVFLRFVEMLEEQDVHTLAKLNDMGAMSPDLIKKAPSYHGIILVKNETGRINLNRLVSASHLDYFNRRPRMPESLIQKYREGLILGSACEAGELFQAVIRGKSEEELAELVRFYDYLEIQPIGNNMFMLESDRYEAKTVEDLQNYNRKIVELGERYHKPVVATCDVHFLNPEDEQYRRILMAGKGFSDADNQAPLYFRTTEEMLEEFAYLGEAKAKEVVITNTNKIADMIEKISPVHPDKCPPVIPKSDETLTKICYDKAHEIYGPDLPDIVEERLQRELNSIISNGFAVMYIIAQKLVWDSNDHGYLVGSRGSVGSSFVATMAGITEVNPLSAHYICPKCHYVDFDSDAVRPYSKKGMSGCDMPDRDCPVCGTPLQKEGHDIPFETFLGFKGNKEPDIDLNFSGDYQSNAHKYTEVIFGKGQTFRAGTIGTLADKTAFGFVKNYYEERGSRKRNCEIDRIVQGCTGIRRSTGQHPGGIIVLPHGEDINSFTPVQHPANDMTTDIITTHFDYHSIDHNLLKLDILGHDDPTMIKTLEELINSDAMENEYDGKEHVFDARDIPLDDPDVMSLFANTSALGITPEDIDGCPVGCLGIPEFGTDFVIQMVVDTKPKTLSDLIRISGLSHGTDVWLNNAQTLILEGKATISTAICTRDDIMTYLINKGMDSELSFTIMEKVRKGKGLTPEFEKSMKEAGVPDWYIWSCKKIKYMFPKAHAAAYVMMAYRIAYCKVNYPLAYYAAYFGIRADAFSYEIMCQGKETLNYYYREYKSRQDHLSKKEQDTMKDMKIVQEMYARGLEFTPIDIYRAKATKFRIIDGKLMPPLSSIDGMGDKAAEAVEQASRDGKYLSKDDFRQRTKASKTVIDKMADLGLLSDLPESNQLSLFDFAD